jgi:hypothetical protein
MMMMMKKDANEMMKNLLCSVEGTFFCRNTMKKVDKLKKIRRKAHKLINNLFEQEESE